MNTKTMSTVMAGLCAGLLLTAMPMGRAEAANGAVGDRLDLAQFCTPDSRSSTPASATLVVLAPAASEYDGMLRLAFNEYFRQGKAFSTLPAGDVRVVHVTGAHELLLSSLPDSDCVAPTDAAALAAIAAATGTALPRSDNADATVLLLDNAGVVRWRDDAYRAQGEHLKPLEAAVKALFDQRDAVADVADAPALHVGDAAPDFVLRLASSPFAHGEESGAQQRLSDLRGKVVMLSFYPAAFSGVLPTLQAVPAQLSREAIDAVNRRAMMCSIQLTEMDRMQPSDAMAKADVVALAISSATPQLLADWRRALGTLHLQYANDPDYAIAQRYASYDARAGYNLRKVYIVDRDGRIAYIDDDYTATDEPVIQAELQRIAARK